MIILWYSKTLRCHIIMTLLETGESPTTLDQFAAGFRVSFFSHIVRLLGEPAVWYMQRYTTCITRRSGDFFSFLHYYDIRVLYARRVAYRRCVPHRTGLRPQPAMWPLECGQRTACMCKTVYECVCVCGVCAQY